jgi:hypothetical protein
MGLRVTAEKGMQDVGKGRLLEGTAKYHTNSTRSGPAREKRIHDGCESGSLGRVLALHLYITPH